MSTLYVYRQTLQWEGRPMYHIVLSQSSPDSCTLSEPVECLGTLALLPVSEIEGHQP